MKSKELNAVRDAILSVTYNETWYATKIAAENETYNTVWDATRFAGDVGRLDVTTDAAGDATTEFLNEI